jgi:ubiquinone/menaquinone biosynthesis C-methylase UbiE
MSLEARLQRRIQRYGWDLAADAYEDLWQDQLSPAHRHLLQQAVPRPGERVLDVACGTGLIALAAASQVGAGGHVTGVDISARMVDAAARRAGDLGLDNTSFLRMEGERLSCGDAGFDLLYCALGLMYMPEWDHALREMHRVLRPGGRIALAVWGERARCAWSAVFPVVDAEVASDVCPLFFQLGHPRMLAELCEAAGFTAIQEKRIAATLHYADADQACDAAFIGGPVAMAWSRFDAATRERAKARYIEAIEPWRMDAGYRLPGEFVVLTARKPVGVRARLRA